MVPCKLLTFLFIFSCCKENKILYIDLKFLKLTIVWLTKLKLTVHLFYLVPPPPLPQWFILQVLWVLQATCKVKEVETRIQGYSWGLSAGS